MSLFLLTSVLSASLTSASPVGLAGLTTVAERSGFVRTGRYDEVTALCAAFAAAEPARVRCTTFGTTPEGREMKALVLSDDGVLDPAAAVRQGRPVIVAQGGIHAGEIDGKDAGFLVLRELLQGRLAPGFLKKATFVFVPVFNVDGHERFGKNNRPNQRGPEEMGWRTTAQNYNLNRDYVKAEAPEMQAMLGLLRAWDPTVYVDLHVTDGAKFQHDVAVIVEPAVAGPEPLTTVARAMESDVVAAINRGGHKGLTFYPSFESYEDPASGFAEGVPPPRLSSPYWAIRNRMGMLVETHSWKPYKERVKATHDVLAALFVLASAQIDTWRKAELEVDARIAAGPGDVVLDYENTDDKILLDFQGYQYVREPSPISGTLRTIYDEHKPEVWRIPLKSTVKPKTVVAAPSAYLVPAAQAAWVRQKLDVHGIRYRVLEAPLTVDVQAFRATGVTFGGEALRGADDGQGRRRLGAGTPERGRQRPLGVDATAPRPSGRASVRAAGPRTPS